MQQILHDVFFKNGQLAQLGIDYNADQKVHMATQPKLPGLFGLEKLVKPVFDYKVDYRWLNNQTGLQNAKQGAWNNTITTGIELNVRDLGIMIFGKPLGEEQGTANGMAAPESSANPLHLPIRDMSREIQLIAERTCAFRLRRIRLDRRRI
jgi:hypothetical protein